MQYCFQELSRKAGLTFGTVFRRTFKHDITALIAALCATPLPARLWARLRQRPWADWGRIPALGALLLLCIAALASQSYNPFIYFRF